MTRHQVARGSSLSPTRNDLRKWRKLVREVRIACRDPMARPAFDLSNAAKAAYGAVAPGRAALQSCAALQRMAASFYGTVPDERPVAAREMARHADQVEAALNAWGQAAPTPRRRADIDDIDDGEN